MLLLIQEITVALLAVVKQIVPRPLILATVAVRIRLNVGKPTAAAIL